MILNFKSTVLSFKKTYWKNFLFYFFTKASLYERFEGNTDLKKQFVFFQSSTSELAFICESFLQKHFAMPQLLPSLS